MLRAWYPDHVPEHLVWDGDIAQFPACFVEPFEEAARVIHQGPDIVWAARNAQFGAPGWLITRHALLREVYMDAERFPARFNGQGTALLGSELPLLPFESDPPLHRHYRQLLQPFFQPNAIRAREAMVREVCLDLIAGFQGDNGCEFVSEFASLLPSHIFIKMFGLPLEMLPQFLEWEHAFLTGDTMEERVGATHEIFNYLKSYADMKRLSPSDDLISVIVNAEVQGRKLTETEVQGMLFLLYTGGLDTVTSSLCWHMRYLARNPELQRKLRAHPETLPQAIEELFRAFPVSNTMRTVGYDLEFHGVRMRKGDVIALPIMFSARDPRAYDDPDVIVPDRNARHLTFGSGVHNCLGIHLARSEIRIALTEILARFENIRIAEGESEMFDFSATWAVSKLALAWEPHMT